MKYKMILWILAVILSLLTASCGFNVFSVFTPTDPEKEEDVNSLVGMGDNYLYNMDYPKAYKAYSKALILAPKNSRALEGASTAYLYMKIPFKDFINSILKNDFSGINQNDLYDVSGFISGKLGDIVDNNADGVIPHTDINTRFNYYIFFSLDNLFRYIDSDINKNVVNDPDDLFFLNSKFTPAMNTKFSNVVTFATNTNRVNPIILIKMGAYKKILIFQHNEFTNKNARASAVLNSIRNSLVSDAGRNTVSGMSGMMDVSVKAMNEFMETMNSSSQSSDSNSVARITNVFQITNTITNVQVLSTNYMTNDSQVTNFIAESGYSSNDYAAFTNDMAGAGVNNPIDLTNIVPGFTNINQWITNYFGL